VAPYEKAVLGHFLQCFQALKEETAERVEFERLSKGSLNDDVKLLEDVVAQIDLVLQALNGKHSAGDIEALDGSK